MKKSSRLTSIGAAAAMVGAVLISGVGVASSAHATPQAQSTSASAPLTSSIAGSHKIAGGGWTYNDWDRYQWKDGSITGGMIDNATGTGHFTYTLSGSDVPKSDTVYTAELSDVYINQAGQLHVHMAMSERENSTRFVTLDLNPQANGTYSGTTGSFDLTLELSQS